MNARERAVREIARRTGMSAENIELILFAASYGMTYQHYNGDIFSHLDAPELTETIRKSLLHFSEQVEKKWGRKVLGGVRLPDKTGFWFYIPVKEGK
jgi:CO/xanthine dehydrogenase Mo-binding subunit